MHAACSYHSPGKLKEPSKPCVAQNQLVRPHPISSSALVNHAFSSQLEPAGRQKPFTRLADFNQDFEAWKKAKHSQAAGADQVTLFQVYPTAREPLVRQNGGFALPLFPHPTVARTKPQPTFTHSNTSTKPLPSPVSPILTPSSTSAQGSTSELPPPNPAGGRRESQAGSELWSDIDDGTNQQPETLSGQTHQETRSNGQRVFVRSRRSSHTSAEAMHVKRSGPRKVPDDIARSKKPVPGDGGPRAMSPLVLTVSSVARAISDKSSGSDRTLKQEKSLPLERDASEMLLSHQVVQQQTTPGISRVPEQRSSESADRSDLSPTQQQQQHHPSSQQAAHEFSPWTPESVGRPALPRGEGSAFMPTPQSMRSPYGSTESPETPSSRPTAPPLQANTWGGQTAHGDDVWTPPPGAGRPMLSQIQSGVSLFHPSGPQQPFPGAPGRQNLPHQSPQSRVRLEDQEQALREHVASRQRPAGAGFGSIMPGPGPWWHHPQMHPASPQAQRPSFSQDGGHGPRLIRPSQTAPLASPASTASSFPNLNKTTLEGYELLASKLAESTIGARPMYRSFEQLNHRLLLYLQDEISEYEQELRNLDEWITQVGSATSDGKPRPASRRAEARLAPTDSELMFRRKFVLGEIFVKMERYCR